MRTRWIGAFGGAATMFLGAAALFGLSASCGDDCDRPTDCDFGELCFDGTCVASTTLGQACGTSSDCVDPQFPQATAQCVAGRCQLRLDRPEIVRPDAGTGADGGTSDGGASDAGDAGAPGCDPADPSTCPLDETCQVDLIGVGTCVPQGTNGLGEACSAGDPCTHDFICLSVDASGFQCYRGCDPANDACVAPQSCSGLAGVTFGICE